MPVFAGTLSELLEQLQEPYRLRRRSADRRPIKTTREPDETEQAPRAHSAVHVRRAGAQDRRQARRRRRRDQPRHRRPRPPDATADRRGDAGGRDRARDAPLPVQPRPRGVPRGRRATSTSGASTSCSTPSTEVIPAIGAKECIFNLNLAFLDPGDSRSPPTPATPSTPAVRWLAGAEPVLMPLVPELGFAPDLGAIDEEVARRAKLMYINYPNNPTGAVVPDGLFERGRRVRPRLRHPRRARQRLLGDRPSTATARRRFSRRPAPRTSASRSSRSPRATT